MTASTSHQAYKRLVSGDPVLERTTFERQPSGYSHQGSYFERPASDVDEIPLVDYPHKDVVHAARRRRSCLSIFVWWWPELLSSLFSVLTLISIIVLLRIYDRKAPTSLHLPRYLTLNGITAALATLNRAFMVAPVGSAIMQEVWLLFSSAQQNTTLHDLVLYDAASRGAFGSFALLFQMRGRRLLTCFGALLTIVSLGFSAFTQQLVAYDLQVPTAPNSPLAPGNLARVETYDQYQGNPAEGASGPNFEFVAAFYSGVLSGGNAPLTAPCPSGNCTWPLTPSLAVCGGCQVSAAYTPPVCFDACETDFSPGQTSAANCTKAPNLYCNYTLPSGAVATLVNWGNSSLGYDTGVGFQAIGSVGAYYNASLQDHLYLANFDLFGAPFETYSRPNMTFTHTECALWFCVETYNTTVTENRQVQQVVSTIDKLDASNYTYVFPPVDSAADPHNVSSFNLTDTLALQVIAQWMNATIAGTIVLDLESQTFSSELMKGIWNGTNDPTAWISNIAMSLTNVVRSTNSTPQAEYNGTAFQPGVSVRWIWLSLPAALVVLSILFLITVMIRTALSPAAPCKGGPMTLLLFDIEHSAREASYGQAHKYKGIQQAVGNMKVGLREEPGKTWRFRAS
ncbi:hypothetical protein LTR53_000790 [Teratosphaeriaceae sp. CCFEE 6253]|nr:hypothetical protein LTR53_000790 [Teratosphaeriaceae sp. CCFEE 6253]